MYCIKFKKQDKYALNNVIVADLDVNDPEIVLDPVEPVAGPSDEINNEVLEIDIKHEV